MRRARACVFCCETSRATNQIVHEDTQVIAMLDRNPRATKHFLVIPREHIPSIDDLTPDHYVLTMVVTFLIRFPPSVSHMIRTGKDILAKNGFVDDGIFGFHRSPFTSVPHVHLHCLGLPFLPVWNSLRFTETMLPSYISAENALAAVNMKRAIDSSFREQIQTDKE
ncbi:hypothetical protein PsorP6_007911 [Peronosclerospora sorghi]|uniref:Uncharacterized protein n=1 Tax=Peronosclerospora sorghi TaxID=230839 RepID=A0ACC0WDK2_9STRA|nr:hypothetical protein PsorP6_007911 [Peronosclerospora sorghi]